MKKIAVLGSGPVGDSLANGFLEHGYAVMRGSRDPAKLAAWKTAAKGEAQTGTFAEAAQWGEIVVLGIKGGAAEELIGQIASHLDGKTVLDATNPIADAPPEHGVVRYFTGPNESLMERLQKLAPAAHFVKAFNSVGNMFFVNPPFKPKPAMFLCGNDAGAKQDAIEICTKFGWDGVDMGAVEVARPIEALCQLWCAPGLARGEWAHAFGWLKPS